MGRARAGQARPQPRFRLLVVDDEAGIREILSAILAQEGYEIQTAEDGVRALELMAQFRPHLVVTDLNMPRMSGLELLQVMRERFPGIPVIFVSGNSPGDQPHAGALADAFVPKGSGIVAQLGATVAELLSARAV